MILTLRDTALRIGDVSMLARDRISPDGDRWRIFLRTEKSGQPVFLPVPPEMKAALDAVPKPLRAADDRYFFWNGVGKPKTQKANVADPYVLYSRRLACPMPMLTVSGTP
jgi:hypothetical protein